MADDPVPGTLVTRSANASIDASTAAVAPQITGLLAGEALDAAAPCYIDDATGKVFMTAITAETPTPSDVAGFTARSVEAGQPVTLFGLGARFRYGTSLTPIGGRLSLSDTPGGLMVGQETLPVFVAQIISGTDIRVTTNI